jgi:N-acetylmuramoyl-L-alanine amidase
MFAIVASGAGSASQMMEAGMVRVWLGTSLVFFMPRRYLSGVVAVLLGVVMPGAGQASPWVAVSEAGALWAQGRLRLGVPETETPNPWHRLDSFQGTMTRDDFETLLRRVYDPYDASSAVSEISDEEILIYPGIEGAFNGLPQYRFRFAPKTAHAEIGESTWDRTPRRYRTPEEFRAIPKKRERPLEGLRVAVDPGHIGGMWAKMEQRSVSYRREPPIQEGDLTLKVAKMLKPRLEALGAQVFLVRSTADPVTPHRPEHFVEEARAILMDKARSEKERMAIEKAPPDSERISKLAELLFFRASEIEERATKINTQFQADVSLALHFNATAGSGAGRLVSSNRNVFFVHGAYSWDEALLPAQSRRMVEKLLEGSLPIEIELAAAIAQAFDERTGYPPVMYGDSKNTRAVLRHNYFIVARNLAANRMINGPVVFCEPYFMNDRITFRRLLAGDYEGAREFPDKKLYPSIFREYVNALVDGLVAVYGPPEVDPFRRRPRPRPTVIAGAPPPGVKPPVSHALNPGEDVAPAPDALLEGPAAPSPANPTGAASTPPPSAAPSKPAPATATSTPTS